MARTAKSTRRNTNIKRATADTASKSATKKTTPARRAAQAKSKLGANRAAPIDVYFWPTPNGRKITIMLEECRLPYRVIPVDISKGEQFKPEFLAISPNNRMPAIVDPDGPGGRAQDFHRDTPRNGERPVGRGMQSRDYVTTTRQAPADLAAAAMVIVWSTPSSSANSRLRENRAPSDVCVLNAS